MFRVFLCFTIHVPKPDLFALKGLVSDLVVEIAETRKLSTFVLLDSMRLEDSIHLVDVHFVCPCSSRLVPFLTTFQQTPLILVRLGFLRKEVQWLNDKPAYRL